MVVLGADPGADPGAGYGNAHPRVLLSQANPLDPRVPPAGKLGDAGVVFYWGRIVPRPVETGQPASGRARKRVR